jgi:chitinase
MTFTVSLTNPSDADVAVDYATAGRHRYRRQRLRRGQWQRSPSWLGATSGTFTVHINGDTTAEPNETFTVTLTNPVGGTLGDGTATGTIANDEASISIADVTQAEGNTGNHYIRLYRHAQPDQRSPGQRHLRD